MTALLGIDLGERRIGIAIAADDGPARPLTTLRRAKDPAGDGASLRGLIEVHAVTELVVGLPFEAAGHEGSQAALTRSWLAAVKHHLPEGLTLTLRDERLTSHLAEVRLGPMRRGRSGGPPTKSQRDAYRARVDREAASIILQDELDARRVDPARSPASSETST